MYTDKQLTSFGNYLLDHYGVQVHSTDGKNVPLYGRQVSHADHCNWLYKIDLQVADNDDAEVMEYAEDDKTVLAVRRFRDGQLFRTNDLVSVAGDSKVQGRITHFSGTDDSRMLFVYTDWSGIGFNLGAIQHADGLPSAYQVNQEVELRFFEVDRPLHAKVLQVHFTAGKIKYDLAILQSGKEMTRVYNIDSFFVSPHVRTTAD